MYTPNRQKIFEDIEVSDECDSLSCHNFHTLLDKPNDDAVCMATSHGECVRVNEIASEVNQFIGDNDDVFVYIQPVGE